VPIGYSDIYLARYSTATLSGIKNIIQNNDFIIYPNPAKDYITIESSRTIDEIKVTSALGETIYLCNSPSSLNINIDNIAGGVYFITLISGAESITQKIIINR
jgi:hypothetical protein